MEQKPLIHLLRSPSGYYFYETNRNEIVSTSKEAYGLLEQVMDPKQEDISDLMAHPILQKLQNLGYLSANRPTIINHPMTSHLEPFLNRKVNKFTLQVTQQCNLRCKYCAYSAPADGLQRGHSARHMSWETAKNAVDFMREHTRESEMVNIGFYGGEPLLSYELIERVIEYATGAFLGKTLTFSMTTNGTLLTDEVVKFCEKNNMLLMISIDGPQEIHDKNRIMAGTEKGSFDIIMKNLQHVSENYPEYFKRIQYNMVIDPENDFDCANHLFMDYSMLQKSNARSTVVDNMLIANPYRATSDFSIKHEYDLFLGYLHEAGRISDHEVAVLSMGYVRIAKDTGSRMDGIYKLPESISHGGPCLPGIQRAMVNVDGTIFPCERCSEISPSMSIGSIYSGFDIQKAQEILNVGALTPEACTNCWALLHCKCCASQIDDGDGLSVTKKLSLCPGIQKQTEHTFLSLILLNEIKQIVHRHETVAAGG